MIFCACGKEAERGKNECFRCRVLSVGYVWRGGGHLYGRSSFSERTNAEFVAEHVGDVRQGLKDGTLAPGSDYA